MEELFAQVIALEERVKSLEAEKARLQRQLGETTEILSNVNICPSNHELPELPCKDATCTDCWKQALASIE